MTSKSRIHTYLVKNKISELFEEMMAKLVHDLPSNPVAYLSELLKKKNLASQKILETKPILGRGSPIRSKSTTANLWSDGPPGTDDKQKLAATLSHKNGTDSSSRTSRQYNKPWLSHSKKSISKDGKGLSQSMPASEKPFWDKNVKNLQDLSQNETTVDGDVDLRLIYAKPKIYGKIPDASSGLEAEIMSNHKGNVKNASVMTQKKTKSLNRDQSKAQRQKALRAIMEKENTNKTAAIDDLDNESDDNETIEVCEDFDDLHNEGVKNPPKGGVHVSRNSTRKKEEIELVLNMSKFFDSLGGAVTPTPEMAVTQDATADIEDDFESASQVTGPRRPVWETPASEVDSFISKHSSMVTRRNKTNIFDISSPTEKKTKSQLTKDNLSSAKTLTERPGSAAHRAAEARRNAVANNVKASEEPTRKRSGGSQVNSVTSNRGSLSHRSKRSSVERPKTAQ